MTTSLLSRTALSGALIVAWAIAPTHVRSQRAVADVIFVNGAVLTVDARDTVHEAVAVAAGKIVAVGSTATIRSLAGDRTEIIDLAGRAVTPGLIDTHLHVAPPSDQLDLGDAAIASIADVLDRLRAEAALRRPGEWIRGRGWDEGKLAERRFLHATDLDKATPDHPVWLTHTTGHYGVANSAALRLAGITRDTPDPPAGTIDRDATGQPTGVMKESAMGLVTRAISGTGARGGRGAGGDPLSGLKTTIAALNREGLTTVKDLNVSEGRWNQYRQLLESNDLTVRIFVLWRAGRTLEAARQAAARMTNYPRLPASLGDGRLLSGGVKLYIDGSGGARTGWMHAPWNLESTGTDGANVGYPTTDPEVFRQQVRLLHDAGVHVGAHAVGDRGMDWVVDAFASALAATPTRGLRHSIIHANLPTDHAIDTMARLQRDFDAAYPELQPPFLWWIGDTYAGNYGPDRSARLIPLRTLQRRGVIWAGGSDYSVTPFAPRYGLWASVAREPLRGTYGKTPFGASEAVDIRTALRSYTAWAARQVFLDDRIGSIEPGKDADLVVWDRNPYAIPSADLQRLRCTLTMVAGRIVFRAPTGSRPTGVRS
jgi:predicted amidohydrolase YtcJ